MTAATGAPPAASAPLPTASAAPERRRPWSLVTAAIATPIVIIALALLPFLTPLWIYPGQERAEADAWTGWPIETVHSVTGSVLADLIIGPPDFDQVVDGSPVFDTAEQGHLRDVRTVLIGFAALALVGAGALAVALWTGRGTTQAWRGVGWGARILVVAILAIGIFSVVAFDTAFELFHRLLFPAGSYTFDPATERLVQLFPEVFWYQTAIAIGIVIIVLSVLVMALAWWRGRIIGAARAMSGAGAADRAAMGAAAPTGEADDATDGPANGAASDPAR